MDAPIKKLFSKFHLSTFLLCTVIFNCIIFLLASSIYYLSAQFIVYIIWIISAVPVLGSLVLFVKNSKNISSIKICCLFFVFLYITLTIFKAGEYLLNKKFTNSVMASNEIIDDLTHYRQLNGKYPDILQEIYKDTGQFNIPKFAVSNSFYLRNNEGYTLSIRNPKTYELYIYNSQKGMWDYEIPD